ncbi:MAG TPA: hypothetical protein VFA03_06135 [Acetobacteraceae bacterium]|nr:hypothetical protein [Acetobacteraceae bacterium]
MAQEIGEAEFKLLVAAAGLTLSAAQLATLRHGYGLFRALLARVNEPMPREAEPALTFDPDVR